MSRLCNRFRQRLTLAHLDQFIVIALEGSENMTREQLLTELVVNHW